MANKRVFVTLPPLLGSRLTATLTQRGWQDQRGADAAVLNEWLLDYARLRGWMDSDNAPPVQAPAPVVTATISSVIRATPPVVTCDDDDGFGFAE